MIVIPAIDLAAGKCVRLRQGDMNQQTIYSDTPADMARHWEAQGAEILHLVDLDGAMGGQSLNLGPIEAIVNAISIPIELGGGLRTIEDVQRMMDLGITWAIMGTSAPTAGDPTLLSFLAEFQCCSECGSLRSANGASTESLGRGAGGVCDWSAGDSLAPEFPAGPFRLPVCNGSSAASPALLPTGCGAAPLPCAGEQAGHSARMHIMIVTAFMGIGGYDMETDCNEIAPHA